MRLLAAIGHCLGTGTAFLGTCGGFQYTAVALARARLRLAGSGHAESDPDASQHVIVALQCALYGERRTVTPVPGELHPVLSAWLRAAAADASAAALGGLII